MSDKATTAGTYVASAATFTFGALNVNELMMILGGIVAVLTFLANLYFKSKWVADDRAYKAALLKEIKTKSTFSIVSDMLKTEDQNGD